MRTIRHRAISKEMEEMVKPKEQSDIRFSIGMEKEVGEYFFISIDRIVPFKNQARKIFDEGELSALSDSIKEYGVRQPLTIIRSEDDKYEVISGERRLIAAKMAGLDKVPCIILKDHNQSDAIALIENIHRQNLHVIELGNAYKRLIDNQVFKSQTELAEKVRISKAHVSECIKYAELPEEMQQEILSKKIESRSDIRRIFNNYKKQQLSEIEDINKKSFSVLRISSENGILKVQVGGVSKISEEQKESLKKHLNEVIDMIK